MRACRRRARRAADRHRRLLPATRATAAIHERTLELCTVVAFDPNDVTRERKRRDRAWAEEAEAAAGGLEALCVSPGGLVGETTRANVFAIVADGTIATPPTRGLLPGVTRSWAIERTGAVERLLPLVELLAGRAAFVTTAGRGIVRIAAIDGRALGDDPLIDALADAWRRL